jgi:ABC-type lipoprotein export system ATPase subunit
MVLGLLGELNRAGKTVVLVTHDAGIAARSKRVVELRDGKIVREERR